MTARRKDAPVEDSLLVSGAQLRPEDFGISS